MLATLLVGAALLVSALTYLVVLFQRCPTEWSADECAQWATAGLGTDDVGDPG